MKETGLIPSSFDPETRYRQCVSKVYMICCILECDIVVRQAVVAGRRAIAKSITTNGALSSLDVTFQPLMGAIDEHVDQLDIQSYIPSQETSIYAHDNRGSPARPTCQALVYTIAWFPDLQRAIIHTE